MFYLEQPSPDQQVLIRQALNEDVNTRDKDLEAIKEWLRKEPHLPDTWDDTLLMNFLRSCNFSLEKTKKRLDKYFTVKAVVPEFFSDCDITRPELQRIVNAIEIATMPGMTPESRRVHIARIASNDFENVDYNDCAKIIFMLGDIRLKVDNLGSAGEVYVLEGENFMLKYLVKLSPIFAKKFLVCATDALPIKVKEVHIVNPPFFIDSIIAFIKPFLKEKILKRIHFHKDVTTLHEYIPKGLLPEEYGGTAGKLKLHWDKYLAACEDFKPWFKEQEKIKADESKRPGKATTYEDFFGLHGSFRSLAVD
ncbi:alpha-tocopherol transfer protein-like isoform X4 [Zophobas morio]|uniref:alpha-tocopherol transfer protein-like isoform X4 n=1 Tax=Zophobas morio TaxID=2755281 RepID=UPI003082AF66